MERTQIKQPFKDMIPPLTSEEYAQLEENVLRDGIIDPIILWGDILMDGHNRYRIAQEHDLDFETVQIDLEDETEAEAWIIKHQLGRRNVSAFDRGKLALRLKPKIAEKAKNRQREYYGNQHDGLSPTLVEVQKEPIDTQEELASIAGVSKGTIHKVEKIVNSGSEKLQEAVENGDMSINQAYYTLKRKEKPKPKPKSQAAKERIEEVKAKDVPTIQDIQRMKKDKALADFYDANDLSQKIHSMCLKIGTTHTIVSRWTDEEIRLCVDGGGLGNVIDSLNRAEGFLAEIKRILSRGVNR